MDANQPAKDEAIRERVLQVAQQLFQQYGLHKVTMEDIARAMGKGKSSLYYYYKNKEDIFVAVLDREINGILIQVAQAVAQAPTPEEKLTAFCLTRFRGLRQNVALNSIVAGEVLRDVDFVYTMRRRYRQREGDLLRQILTLPAADGSASWNPQDLDAMVFVLLSSLHGLEQELLLTNDFTLVEPAIRLLSRALMNGLKI